jgi:hypothetical protein
MPYLYENTVPERFQRFCQSLLLDEYPGLQCFPVGQPDGGRDAWQPGTNTVLQVKFRRNDDPESAEWMIEALEGELPKIRRLVAAGATQYVMVTNARGTAHLGAGRIDKVQKWMDENIDCSALCLWRDDLDARFDVAPTTLKIKYPELLTGQDGIELALGQVFGPQKEKQLRAVRAFAAAQFEKDKAVKFKQVNLSNELVDLFIDIPLRVNENLAKQLRRRARSEGLNSRAAEERVRRLGAVPEDLNSLSEDGPFYFHGGGALRTRVGAAQFLLGRNGQDDLKRIILQGAPGQGKSTLAQFVCQVHRARFLGKAVGFLDQLSSDYLESGFRLPIKIDLRDLAAFVSVHDDPTTASLEEFISQAIHEASGKLTFTADDLVDVFTATPTLLFLDGLDEVADLDQRRELIHAVERSLTRFDQWGADVQVVVTSRPSIFGKKASFEASGFVVIDLANIDPRLVTDYSKKWVVARGLDGDESREVLSILRDKMELPHIRELTRNPMQLTILLSLIHQVGYSLPDQRTDLYRRYLELFLIREAEKTPSVKKHSAVLVSFIQHLAWVLQSQAESAGSTGSISEAELQGMASDYLIRAKEPPELADDLFGGGLERIFVLVQRVSGLYEFEVQPLREFFCARHLYETSPVGTYRYQQPKGDRAQRFEALAANPFWLNVTRFYAGSYEPGEIGSLVMSLKELIASPDTAVSIHARRVAFALLSDWVFANKKSWQDELIAVACDDLGLDLLADQLSEGETIALDEDCGQFTLRRLLFARLSEVDRLSTTQSLCVLLDVNGGASMRSEFETLVKSHNGRKRSDFLARMILSGATDSMPLTDLLQFIKQDGPGYHDLTRRLGFVLDRHSSHIQKVEAAMQEVVIHVLHADFDRGARSFDLLSVFADLLNRTPSGLTSIYRHQGDGRWANQDVKRIEQYAAPASLVPGFVRSVMSHENPVVSESYRPDYTKSRVIAEMARESWGESQAADEIALRAAGLQTSESVTFASTMFDETIEVCARARYARLKRGSVDWWRQQLDDADTDEAKRMFWATLVLCWTSPAVFAELRSEAERCVDTASDDRFSRLTSIISAINHDCQPRRDRLKWVPDLSRSSDRSALAISLAARMTADQISTASKGRESPYLRRWADELLLAERLAKPHPKDAKESSVLGWLKDVADAQRANVNLSYRIAERCRSIRLGPAAASRVARDSTDYPREAVARARDIVMHRYSPDTLTTVSHAGEWQFD